MRIALDTNLWSALATQDAGDDFHSYASTTKTRVVVPPATILEAARTPDPAIRHPMLRLLGDSHFEHTGTEAALEAEEWMAAATS